MPTAVIEKICSQRRELAAFIDGELSLREELELEAHLAVCLNCRTELNEQKKLLCVLDFALEDEREFELPANFTKIVIANAESKVSGLRRPQERFTALFICAALFLLGIIGLGGETAAILNTFANFAEQFRVVVGFGFHLFYDLALGTAIILRSIGSTVIFNSATTLTITIILFGGSLIVLSRLIVRSPRLKIQTQEK